MHPLPAQRQMWYVDRHSDVSAVRAPSWRRAGHSQSDTKEGILAYFEVQTRLHVVLITAVAGGQIDSTAITLDRYMPAITAVVQELKVLCCFVM